jgi:hypothetical protein
VKDSEGNTLESSSRLIDLAHWIEPEALTSWDSLIPTPEELCDCQNDFPFGEEEDDGSYHADEYRFRLMAEGGFVICEPDPQWYLVFRDGIYNGLSEGTTCWVWKNHHGFPSSKRCLDFR